MVTGVEPLIDAFYRVKVPASLRHLSPEAITDQEVRVDFFEEVKNSLMSHLAAEAVLEENEIVLDPRPQPGRSVSYMHELALREGAPLAFAHTTQEPTGEREVTFGLYPLQPSTIAALQEIESLSKIIG